MKSRLLIVIPVGWFLVNVGWAATPVPVPAKGGLPECEAELAVCTGDLDSCDVALGTCTTDLATCGTDLGTCTTELTETTVDLVQCESDLANCQATAEGSFPASGQTSCWDSLGNLIDCAGTGHDGDIQAGADLSYTDTGLTIIDNNTKLEWMKQDDNNLLSPVACDSLPGSLDKDCVFTWDEAFAFVASLNAANYAGGGWRVPNMKELQSIVNYEKLNPVVSVEFNTGSECISIASCTVETCSCTKLSRYWSSTTTVSNPLAAWDIAFGSGVVGFHGKFDEFRVRAVRDGP